MAEAFGFSTNLRLIHDPHGLSPLEVKLGASPDTHDVRHLHWLSERIGDDLIDALVLTTGPQAYRRADGIAVIPAALLGP